MRRQMTDDDYDALAQKQLASIKRDMKISLEDAAVRATHKVMARSQTKGEEHMNTEDDEFKRIERESGWRKRQIQKVIEDDDDIQVYKKPWVGLTDEERDYFTYIDAKDKARFRKYANYIETKLKEKNT